MLNGVCKSNELIHLELAGLVLIAGSDYIDEMKETKNWQGALWWNERDQQLAMSMLMKWKRETSGKWNERVIWRSRHWWNKRQTTGKEHIDETKETHSWQRACWWIEKQLAKGTLMKQTQGKNKVRSGFVAKFRRNQIPLNSPEQDVTFDNDITTTRMFRCTTNQKEILGICTAKWNPLQKD